MQDRAPTHARGGGSAADAYSGLVKRGTEELRQLAREAADPVGLLEDAWRAVFDCSPRLSHRKWARTLRLAVRRGDRYGELGEHTPGYGVGWVIDRMQEDAALDPAKWPHSLAFYVQRLDFESRDWRRDWRPQIRATRDAAREVMPT